MTEALMARGRYAELEIQSRRELMAAEDSRRALREAVAPYVPVNEIDAARVVYLAAQLVKAVEDHRRTTAEMAALKREYNL